MAMSVSKAIEGDFLPFEQILNEVEDTLFGLDDLSPSMAIEEFQTLQRDVRRILSKADYSSLQQGHALRKLDRLATEGLEKLGLMKDINYDFRDVLKKMARVREEFAVC